MSGTLAGNVSTEPSLPTKPGEAPSRPDMKTGWESNLKYISLVILTLQNAALILWIRYVRTRDVDVMFLSTSAVACAEFVKCVTALCLLWAQQPSMGAFGQYLYSHLVLDPMDNLKIAVPSLVYTLQNNLQFVAVSNLDAATYQVSYQLKILTTALFSVAMLNKQLSRMQWVSLLILFAGVSVVQLQSTTKHTDTTASSQEQNWVVGIIAVIVSCLMSGFAGVYFEKILKESKASVWLRNVQLGALGTVIGLITVYAKDGATVREKGFFGGYDWAVLLAIALQSLGGLVVAVVVKYADNILKGFATSAAIVISCIVSIMFLGFVLSVQFVVGAALVIGSVYVYSAYAVQPSQLASNSSKV